MDHKKLERLQQQIEQAEKLLKKKCGDVLCPNHELELYLVEYYQKKEYDLVEQPLHRMYYEMSRIYKECGQKKAMWDAIERAYTLNPADLEISFFCVMEFYRENDLESMFSFLQDIYPYIYTRRDLAEYYKFLAMYYLEKYQPELAEALYMYSNLFFQNEQSNQDLKFIDAAVSRKMKDWSPEQLQKYLKEHQIPLQSSKTTLGLLYHTAIACKRKGEEEYARQLLFILYEQTQDKEIEKMLNEKN